MIKATNPISLERDSTYRHLETTPKRLLTWDRCQNVTRKLVGRWS